MRLQGNARRQPSKVLKKYFKEKKIETKKKSSFCSDYHVHAAHAAGAPGRRGERIGRH
jgi:hypothetical protein